MHILLTGASGNLGSELARQLAKSGITLSLWGRDAKRLAAVAGECEARGAIAAWSSHDLDDLDHALAALSREDAAQPFDVVLLVAGQGGTQAPDTLLEDPTQVARQCHINFTVPAAMAAHIATQMCARSGGKIGLIGSAAGFHSLPFAPSYSGSKAGLARFADALRLAARKHGVSVTMIAPGFIAPASPSTDQASRPSEMPVGKVAAAIIMAVMKGRADLVIPRRFVLLRWLDHVLPRALRDRLLLALPAP